MLSALIGWKAAGWAGAVTATVALYLPSSLLVYGAARLWGRWRGSVWHSAVERGLAPIAAGLILSGGIAVLRVSPGGAAVWIAAVVATVLCWAGRASIRWPCSPPAEPCSGWPPCGKLESASAAKRTISGRLHHAQISDLRIL